MLDWKVYNIELLQSFLEAHFVYLCLVRSLELSLALFPSPVLSYVLECSGLRLCLSDVYIIFHMLPTFYHMPTIFTC